MKKMSQLVFTLLMIVVPTVQLVATETSSEKFKQKLLEEIREEIKEMEPSEIRRIINEVEASINEYIETYETNANKLRTKDEVYLEQHRDEVSPQSFSMLQTESGKSEAQLMLEELNPKLKMLSDDDYYYNEETKEIDFTMSKDKMFSTEAQMTTFGTKWDYLAVGDVLINFDNGFSGKHFGHAALMWSKSNTTRKSKTLEAPGIGDRVRIMEYDRWHYNTKDRITYNYVPAVYKTNIPALAALNATRYNGTWYGLGHPLGMGLTMYCTELVFLAYLGQGISLGNGMKFGSPGILFPGSMYCDPKLMYYYRQKVGGGMCQ